MSTRITIKDENPPNKYIAYIDILGFKEKLINVSQSDAEEFIRNFSSMLYRQWESHSYQIDKHIRGLIVSDCIIIHTLSTSPKALDMLLQFLVDIYQKAFSENGILLRGAVTKGQFNQLEAYSFENLQKGLIIGQAYIDAYTLESKYKGCAILFKNNVLKDIFNNFKDRYEIINIDENNSIYSLGWAKIDYLMEENNLSKFVKMACEAKWIPHYYHTMYLFLKNQKDETKEKQVFFNVYNCIKNCTEEDIPRNQDIFIKNAFSNDVDNEFQQMFLRFVREKIEN